MSLDPDRQLRVLLVVARDDAVTIHPLVDEQFIPSFLPDCVMGIPDESNLVQETDSFVRESRSLSVDLELVLVALALDPLGQRGVSLVVMRDVAVPVEPPELTKVFKLFVSDLCLVLTKAYITLRIISFLHSLVSTDATS